jgi:hypothetical protein
MEKGRLYPQIGERYIDSTNINRWPPRRCRFIVAVIFDGVDCTFETDYADATITSDRKGVEYHQIHDNGHGRLWTIDWGMKLRELPEGGVIRWVQVLDNPSGAYFNIQSDLVGDFIDPWWHLVVTWLPLPDTIHLDPRFTGFIQLVPAAAGYY